MKGPGASSSLQVAVIGCITSWAVFMLPGPVKPPELARSTTARFPTEPAAVLHQHYAGLPRIEPTLPRPIAKPTTAAHSEPVSGQRMPEPAPTQIYQTTQSAWSNEVTEFLGQTALAAGANESVIQMVDCDDVQCRIKMQFPDLGQAQAFLDRAETQDYAYQVAQTPETSGPDYVVVLSRR